VVAIAQACLVGPRAARDAALALVGRRNYARLSVTLVHRAPVSVVAIDVLVALFFRTPGVAAEIAGGGDGNDYRRRVEVRDRGARFY
jgi:hypothetical protein